MAVDILSEMQQNEEESAIPLLDYGFMLLQVKIGEKFFKPDFGVFLNLRAQQKSIYRLDVSPNNKIFMRKNWCNYTSSTLSMSTRHP